MLNTNNAGAGSLRQAVADANASAGADVIEFSGSLFSDATPDTILLTTGRMTITDDLLIQGTGANQLTLTAAGSSQLFYITGASTDVTIDGLTLTGGRAIGTSFNTKSGGAIFNDNSGLTLSNSVLTGNSSNYDGGGLFNLSGTVSVIDSTITNNSAVRAGGGLTSNGRLNVTGSDFSLNSAVYGGAIANGQQGTLDLQQGTQSGNTASLHGAGVFNYFGSATVSGVTFSDNSSIQTGTVTNWSGTLSLTGSHFLRNTAEFGGGVANVENGVMSVARSDFADNVSTRDGGGLFNGTGGTLTLVDSTFVRNQSALVGGALIGGRRSTTTIINTTMSENTSNQGGAIANIYDARMTLVNSTISGNDSYSTGGGIYNDGNLTLTNDTIVINHSGRDGGNGGDGGGLITTQRSQVVTSMDNTLVAGNTRGALGSESGNDIGGKALTWDSAYNLISTPDFAEGLVHGVNGNIVGQSGVGGTRVLLPVENVINLTLADNGGPTLTHALAVGSAAINAGSNALALDANGLSLTTDQRGNGFPRINGGTVDIGAYEI